MVGKELEEGTTPPERPPVTPSDGQQLRTFQDTEGRGIVPRRPARPREFTKLKAPPPLSPQPGPC